MSATRTDKPETGPPVVVFPMHGCEAARPLGRRELEAQQKQRMNAVKKHWEHEGVKAVLEILEMEAAVLQRRACLAGATQHDAGQAYALDKVVGELQKLRWM